MIIALMRLVSKSLSVAGTPFLASSQDSLSVVVAWELGSNSCWSRVELKRFSRHHRSGPSRRDCLELSVTRFMNQVTSALIDTQNTGTSKSAAGRGTKHADLVGLKVVSDSHVTSLPDPRMAPSRCSRVSFPELDGLLSTNNLPGYSSA